MTKWLSPNPFKANPSCVHVYADDGFESSHTSERAARQAAARGSRRRRGVHYYVVACSAAGHTGGGEGRQIAEYLYGREIG